MKRNKQNETKSTWKNRTILWGIVILFGLISAALKKESDSQAE